MNSKVKGLLKGLRYISQIFEANTEEEEEPEMQIGLPTDVKHVAHIGWDGPSVNTPSWMTEFRNAPLSSLGAEAMGEINPTNLNQNARIIQGSPLRDSRKAIVDSDSHVVPEPPPSKSGRRHASSNHGHEPESPQSAPRQSRRNKSAEAAAHAESSDTDGQVEEPHRRSRRQHRVKEPGSGNEAGATTQDGPGIPKQVRKKKKPKCPSGEGTGRSSSSNRPRRSTGQSDPDLDYGKPESAPPLSTVDE